MPGARFASLYRVCGNYCMHFALTLMNRLSDRKDTILTWDQLHPSRSPTSVAPAATSELTAAADRRPLTSTASGVIDGSGTSRDHDGMSSAEQGQENVAVGNLTQAEYHDDHAASYDLAHGLHYASIGMLGILVIEVM
jgi:hypothetical protein